MLYEKSINRIVYCYALVLLGSSLSCTEPFEIPSSNTEGLLVVDARLTTERKRQSVVLSRAVPLDSIFILGESGAMVDVTDNTGNTFSFNESETGTYISDLEFSALPNRTYTLTVQTQDGNRYSSPEVLTPPLSKMDRVYAEKGIKDSLEQGVFIYVDNTETTEEKNYYKYEYEETFKIIAPFWVNQEAYFNGPAISLRPRIQNERICYGTQKSNQIIQATTTRQTTNNLVKFPVRFIDRENYILTHRYSILVRQFSQTAEAFNFYETLNDISSVDNLFSQIQTGFFEGNVRNNEDASEQVLGYFEVSGVSEKRIFFNFEDFFSDDRRPNFPFDCSFQVPLEGLPFAVEFEILEFYDLFNPSTITGLPFLDPGPYLMVPRVCGDCTVLGSNTVPDFWVE